MPLSIILRSMHPLPHQCYLSVMNGIERIAYGLTFGKMVSQ